MMSLGGEHRVLMAEGVPTCLVVPQKFRLSRLSRLQRSHLLYVVVVNISSPIADHGQMTAFTASSSAAHLCIAVGIVTPHCRCSVAYLLLLVFDLTKFAV